MKPLEAVTGVRPHVHVDARPFLKYVGGKTQLLPELRKHVPDRFGLYFEPFLGGGALFFDLASTRSELKAILSDDNPRLASTYRAVRDDVDTVIARLAVLQGMWRRRNDSERSALYYKIRDRFNDAENADSIANAARMIFVNKTGYNGLWRVNKSGAFNVPIGRSKSEITICDRENLLAASRELSMSDVAFGDFSVAFKDASRGDFVYADSPYWPVSETADFTTYTKDGFSGVDQTRLRDAALAAKARGVHVLLSNADCLEVQRLYKKSYGFEWRSVNARRSVNCRGKKRGVVGELLIW